ncbi:hypothetical protein GALLR39Z86_45310 [Glycomyces algeriensis]|uniref:Uncharacterized protein n=1 Tax=Glycomyces algeriensis TaxID=256037 RepID=A0A9W6GD25_9ACTN|nr:hypothetical protein GALLR39Z86_45310 [Glycomyces algeriensis]
MPDGLGGGVPAGDWHPDARLPPLVCDPGTFVERWCPDAAILVRMDDSPSHKPWLTSERQAPITATPQRGER